MTAGALLLLAGVALAIAGVLADGLLAGAAAVLGVILIVAAIDRLGLELLITLRRRRLRDRRAGYVHRR